MKPARIAVVGQVAAGDPVDGVEYLPFIKWYETHVPDWARENDHFFGIEIVGDSLNKLGIATGDIAVVYRTHDVRDGDLAAVLTPFGTTIKFVFSEIGNTVRLEGASDSYIARSFDVEDVTIQGRVVNVESPNVFS
jgi:SOS-response transcriptional repressor LexA